MTDVAIVGKGPAGWSCAMTARMRGLNVVVIAPQNDNCLLKKAERVDNYPGMPLVSGQKLLDLFREQAIELGAEERFGLVRQIMPLGESFMLLVENEVVEAKSVVLAMGAARPKLLPGEEELVGQGISYCATCDGMFYRGKKIAVLSSSDQGAEETGFLTGLAEYVDYYMLKRHQIDKLDSKAVVINEKPISVSRTDAGIVVATEQTSRSYDGVFVFRTALPLNMLMAELKTEGSYIPVDRQRRTNIPGVFAAGDCTGKPLQVPKAVGEGNIAAISAAEWIAGLDEKAI